MDNTLQNFYYNKQLKRYLIQFMAVFSNMHVQVGWTGDKEPRLIKVPIYNASKDRVVAAIKGDNTQNKVMRLPAFSATITNIDMAPELRKGVKTERRQTYMPTGRLFPDDIKVVQQKMPVPYKATYELNLWVSNQDQHYQIYEMIGSVFDPILQIQTSDEIFDWTQITTLELMGSSMNENYPAGGDRRLIPTTFTFQSPIYLSIPADVHNKFVNDIYVRVGAVNQATNMQDAEDIIGQFNEQDIEYELNSTIPEETMDDGSVNLTVQIDQEDSTP